MGKISEENPLIYVAWKLSKGFSEVNRVKEVKRVSRWMVAVLVDADIKILFRNDEAGDVYRNVGMLASNKISN